MTDYDLIVVGGGPAGATLGTLVALAGHRVLLLERERFPRYQIGESLLPATVSGICELLGLRRQVDAGGFVLKRGATFSWGNDPGTCWTLNFGRAPVDRVALDPDTPYAYNVPRPEFDRMLLDNAAEKGVDVRIGCRATALLREGGRVCGVRWTDPDGHRTESRSRFVANASGQSGLGGSTAGRREYSLFFRKLSVFGYYNNGGRLPRPLDGNVFFETVGDTWLWYIPLSDRLTSVGAVLPAEQSRRIKPDARLALERYIAGCPGISGFLEDAEPAAEPPFDAVRTRSEFSYCTSCFWEPGHFLVGDAACFVDVLLSSGVHLATYGALLAARSVNAILDRGMDEAHCMNEYEARLRQEYAVFYQGLVGLYDMERDSDTYIAWLRTLLRDTNGVFIEWQEPRGNGARRAGGGAGLARGNVERLRAHNARQVRYDGSPVMDLQEPAPVFHHSLQTTEDWLSWKE